MYFIDSHAHLYLEAFHQDLESVIQEAIHANVTKFVMPNIDLNSIECMMQIQHTYPLNCFPTLGLHPCDVKSDYIKILHEFENTLNKYSIYGIGETGTDAYWDTTYWQQQIDAFTTQIQWAKQLNKPIIIHSRESLHENISLISKLQDGTLRGVFHCFGGTLDQANAIISSGFNLGIGGTITYKKNTLKEVISQIGLNHVLLETDSPFLSPEPHRGKRNVPAHIPIVAEFISNVLDCSIETVATQTTQNAEKLFGLQTTL